MQPNFYKKQPKDGRMQLVENYKIFVKGENYEQSIFREFKKS